MRNSNRDCPQWDFWTRTALSNQQYYCLILPGVVDFIFYMYYYVNTHDPIRMGRRKEQDQPEKAQH